MRRKNSYVELLEVVDVSEDDSRLEEESRAQQDPGWTGIDDHLRGEGGREGRVEKNDRDPSTCFTC